MQDNAGKAPMRRRLTSLLGRAGLRSADSSKAIQNVENQPSPVRTHFDSPGHDDSSSSSPGLLSPASANAPWRMPERDRQGRRETMQDDESLVQHRRVMHRGSNLSTPELSPVSALRGSTHVARSSASSRSSSDDSMFMQRGRSRERTWSETDESSVLISRDSSYTKLSALQSSSTTSSPALRASSLPPPQPNAVPAHCRGAEAMIEHTLVKLSQTSEPRKLLVGFRTVARLRTSRLSRAELAELAGYRFASTGGSGLAAVDLAAAFAPVSPTQLSKAMFNAYQRHLQQMRACVERKSYEQRCSSLSAVYGPVPSVSAGRKLVSALKRSRRASYLPPAPVLTEETLMSHRQSEPLKYSSRLLSVNERPALIWPDSQQSVNQLLPAISTRLATPEPSRQTPTPTLAPALPIIERTSPSRRRASTDAWNDVLYAERPAEPAHLPSRDSPPRRTLSFVPPHAASPAYVVERQQHRMPANRRSVSYSPDVERPANPRRASTLSTQSTASGKRSSWAPSMVEDRRSRSMTVTAPGSLAFEDDVPLARHQPPSMIGRSSLTMEQGQRERMRAKVEAEQREKAQRAAATQARAEEHRKWDAELRKQSAARALQQKQANIPVRGHTMPAAMPQHRSSGMWSNLPPVPSDAHLYAQASRGIERSYSNPYVSTMPQAVPMMPSYSMPMLTPYGPVLAPMPAFYGMPPPPMLAAPAPLYANSYASASDTALAVPNREKRHSHRPQQHISAPASPQLPRSAMLVQPEPGFIPAVGSLLAQPGVAVKATRPAMPRASRRGSNMFLVGDN